MAKKNATKRVWTPEIHETTIGGGTYIIEPQPIERIIEFDGVVKQLSTSLDEFNDTYYVANGTGEDLAGPFEDEDEARDYIEQYPDKKLDVRVQGVTMRDVLETIVSTPYPALKVLVPDLKEEDVKGASLPNLKFVFDILVEVNGVAWFERLIKNSLAPLQPVILEMLVEGIKGALGNTTSTSKETSGETA